MNTVAPGAEPRLEPEGHVAEQDGSRPIVSVNEGPRRHQPWMFYCLLAVLGVAAVVGTVLVLRKYNPREMVARQQPQQQPVGTSIETRGAFATKPLVGADDGPRPAASSAGTSLNVDEAGASSCADKPVLDPTSGKPIMGANGKPLMVTCDGRTAAASAAPAKAGMPTITLSGAVAGEPGGAASAPVHTMPAVVDRYAGGIILEPPAAAASKAGQLPPVPADAVRLLQQVQSSGGIDSVLGRLAAAQGAAGSTGLGAFGQGGLPAGPISPPSSARPAASRASQPRETRQGTARDMATRLDGDRLMVLRGSQIECYLTLAYVSEIAGEAHCVVARDVFGHDGSTLLIERGSRANGAFQAVNGLGDRRALVIWDRIVTPGGVVVTFSSKGTDALGSTGMAAEVDQRWADRIGVATAISAVKDLTTAIAARYSASQSVSSMVSSSQNFADEILRQTIAIKPTLYLKQGDVASIVLQSDLDFGGVYALRR